MARITYTKNEVREEIRQMCVDWKMISLSRYEKGRAEGMPGRGAVLEMFDGWDTLAKELGFVTGRSKKTMHDIDGAIQLVLSLSDGEKMPTREQYDAAKGKDLPHSVQLVKRFGGWQGLAENLALEYQGRGRKDERDAKEPTFKITHIKTGIPVYDLLATVFHLAHIDAEKDDPDAKEFLKNAPLFAEMFAPSAITDGSGKQVPQ